MKMKEILYTLAFVFIIIIIGNTVIVAQTDMKPPVAKKEPKVTEIHGYKVTDNYYWLRSAKDPKTGKVRKEVEDYLTAENAYTDSVMKPYEGFTHSLYDEMLAKIKQ